MMTTEICNSERERIGQRITEIRSAKNMTIQELSEASGIKPANLIRIEAGRYATTLDILNKIAQALKSKIEIVENF